MQTRLKKKAEDKPRQVASYGRTGFKVTNADILKDIELLNEVCGPDSSQDGKGIKNRRANSNTNHHSNGSKSKGTTTKTSGSTSKKTKLETVSTNQSISAGSTKKISSKTNHSSSKTKTREDHEGLLAFTSFLDDVQKQKPKRKKLPKEGTSDDSASSTSSCESPSRKKQKTGNAEKIKENATVIPTSSTEQGAQESVSRVSVGGPASIVSNHIPGATQDKNLSAAYVNWLKIQAMQTGQVLNPNFANATTINGNASLGGVANQRPGQLNYQEVLAIFQQQHQLMAAASSLANPAALSNVLLQNSLLAAVTNYKNNISSTLGTNNLGAATGDMKSNLLAPTKENPNEKVEKIFALHRSPAKEGKKDLSVPCGNSPISTKDKKILDTANNAGKKNLYRFKDEIKQTKTQTPKTKPKNSPNLESMLASLKPNLGGSGKSSSLLGNSGVSRSLLALINQASRGGIGGQPGGTASTLQGEAKRVGLGSAGSVDPMGLGLSPKLSMQYLQARNSLNLNGLNNGSGSNQPMKLGTGVSPVLSSNLIRGRSQALKVKKPIQEECRDVFKKKKPFKRAATHVAISYYVYYQKLKQEDPRVSSYDPTLRASIVRQETREKIKLRKSLGIQDEVPALDSSPRDSDSCMTTPTTTNTTIAMNGDQSTQGDDRNGDGEGNTEGTVLSSAKVIETLTAEDRDAQKMDTTA